MSRARGTSELEGVRTEGGLLPGELLGRIARSDKTVPGLSPDHYHVPPGETLAEAITRAWNRLCGAWISFRDERERSTADDALVGVTRNRWLLPLFNELGFGRLTKASPGAFDVEGRSYALSHLYHRSPIHLVGWNVSLDVKAPGITGAAAASPHGLVQDFLNRSDAHLWAFVSNGRILRILRDNHSLTRQAYVEFDLESIFDGEMFHAFRLLWLLCHQSRVEAEKPDECWLEKWVLLAREEGIRALDHLRDGVERAIETLGRGFLARSENKELAARLESGALPTQDYYRELLRLVYRLIFLFVAEDRDLLLDPDASEEARTRFRKFYSTRHLRETARTRRGTAHTDQWRQLRTLMRCLDDGYAPLALPGLGSFLWSRAALPDVEGAEIANADLLDAIRHLATTVDARGQRYPVSWRNVGAEELGSVYESLLELHPTLHGKDGFRLSSAEGHERKTTGSYYTPTSLVDCLLETALDPIIREAVKGKTRADAERALLDLKVCDPACGSGHFLIAAGRRIARRLAQLRVGEEEPSPQALQHALRDVVGRCLFGVDINPMAVELCKVGLWLEAVEPGKPLSFLDAHIQNGNALLGTTPGLLARGIPDEAFEPLEGDDKAVASSIKRQNKSERGGQTTMAFGGPPPSTYVRLGDGARDVDAAEDASLPSVRAKASKWDELVASPAYANARFLADLWCAAFVWTKKPGTLRELAPTEATYRKYAASPTTAPPELRREVARIRDEYQLFHWHLAFPHILRASTSDAGAGWDGGFDVVLGNPPWEKVKLVEKEFFAERAPNIARAATSAARTGAIEALKNDHPELLLALAEARRNAEGTSHLLRRSGRFPLCGKGDVNTYAVFAEHSREIIATHGRAGFIVPSGIATDDTTKEFFQAVVERNALVSLYDFQSGGELFGDIGHARFKFSLVTLGTASAPEFAFGLRKTAQLADADRRFRLTPEDIALVNPNTRTCPIFRSRRDAEIVTKIYRRLPVLMREGADGVAAENSWHLTLATMFHMSNDSPLFVSRPELMQSGWTLVRNHFRRDQELMLPLYEAKMMNFFDHRAAGVLRNAQLAARQNQPEYLTDEHKADPERLPLPNSWVNVTTVRERVSETTLPWFLGFRDITSPTNERTFITAVIPFCAVGNKLPLLLSAERHRALLSAILASFAFDFVARSKVGGVTLNFFIVKQLAILPPQALEQRCPWANEESVARWLTPRVLELTYTAVDLKSFAHELGWDGPPFIWRANRRLELRAEIDAAMFHLFGLERCDADHILDTFPIVKRHEEDQFGEYRTKRMILETYDAMADAIRSGTPYQTRLDPAPAHPSLAHSPKEGK